MNLFSPFNIESIKLGVFNLYNNTYGSVGGIEPIWLKIGILFELTWNCVFLGKISAIVFIC